MHHDPAFMGVAIRTAVGFFALVVVVQWMLVPTLAEKFRCEVFGLRRELFVLMAEGRVRPDHPAYVRLRTTMNGMLRFAERLTFTRFLWIAFINRDRGLEFANFLDDAIEAVEEDETRKQLHSLRIKLGEEMVRHVLRSSPLAWLLGALAFIVIVTVQLVAKGDEVKDQIGKAIAATEADAEAEAHCSILPTAA